VPTHLLAARIESAVAANPDHALAAWQDSIGQHVLSDLDPRKLIDTPEERLAIEQEAVLGFDRYVKPSIVAKLGDMIGGAAVSFIEPQLVKLLDVLFVALAATLPPPAPTPAPVPVTTQPQGSAP
jgi:hypothetical protein